MSAHQTMSAGQKMRTRLEDLSPEQQQVVRSWGRGLAVMAGAGSGKTTTLVIKCEELLKRNPQARFAAVSFTEKSTSDLRAKLSERLSLQGPGVGLSGHWVMTIHGLCNAILREYPREAGFDGEESMLAEAEAQLLWDQAVDGLWFEDRRDPALDLLLARESRDSLHALLKRTRELSAFGALEWLKQAQGSPTEILASQALVEVATWVLERYERIKKRRGALDFNDLERGADRALEHEEIRRAYQEKFELIMVDEFQDTNPVQARIIRRFCRSDGSNLCVVGDPKQSIYRFRDADVSVFEEFCAWLPERHSLTWNFRSRPGIIDYTNSLCEKTFQASLMPYEPLIPKREAHESLAPVVRLDVKSPEELGAWILNEVQQGVPLENMALLLRKIRGNEHWLKALTTAGIPIAVGSGGLFWEDPRVRELTCFLKWWDHPGNNLSGAIFLRAPWVGISDLLLDEWVRRDPTFVEPFFQSEHPLARRLAPYRGRVVRPAELLLALLVDQATEAELGTSLLGLWHRTEDLSSRGLDFHAVVRELAQAIEQGRRERDVPPPRNQGQLSVLTLHGAKGLEFQHVILVDLGVKARAPDTPLLFWDRENGAYLAARDEKGERDPQHPIESIWRARERQKALAESKRLFYVALTRAQERLILVCPEIPPKQPPKNPPKKSTAQAEAALADPFSQDDWREWVEKSGGGLTKAHCPTEKSRVVISHPPDFHSVLTTPASNNSGSYRRPRHSVTEWVLLSRCPRAYEWSVIRPRLVLPRVPNLEQRLDPSPQQAISDQELGTQVHLFLERRDFTGLRQLEQAVGALRFRAEPLIEWTENSPWMAPLSAGDLGREVWAELAFEVLVGKEILVGSMDRVVRNQDHYTIVDFKVTQKPKSKHSLLEAYQTQLALYADALRLLLPAVQRAQAQIACLLVNISPGSIQEVSVSVSEQAQALSQNAAKIVSGQAGMPRPSSFCQHCDHRGRCEAAPVYEGQVFDDT